MFYDNNIKNHILCLYRQLSPSKMKTALPISYINDPENNILVAYFINGTDYLGQDTYDNVLCKINEHNILTHTYEEVNQIFKNTDMMSM